MTFSTIFRRSNRHVLLYADVLEFLIVLGSIDYTAIDERQENQPGTKLQRFVHMLADILRVHQAKRAQWQESVNLISDDFEEDLRQLHAALKTLMQFEKIKQDGCVKENSDSSSKSFHATRKRAAQHCTQLLIKALTLKISALQEQKKIICRQKKSYRNNLSVYKTRNFMQPILLGIMATLGLGLIMGGLLMTLHLTLPVGLIVLLSLGIFLAIDAVLARALTAADNRALQSYERALREVKACSGETQASLNFVNTDLKSAEPADADEREAAGTKHARFLQFFPPAKVEKNGVVQKIGQFAALMCVPYKLSS